MSRQAGSSGYSRISPVVSRGCTKRIQFDGITITGVMSENNEISLNHRDPLRIHPSSTFHHVSPSPSSLPSSAPLHAPRTHRDGEETRACTFHRINFVRALFRSLSSHRRNEVTRDFHLSNSPLTCCQTYLSKNEEYKN